MLHGAKWINKNYGDYLRKGQYKDAFHIHNTGRPYPIVGQPKTYHRLYVPNGLKYIEEFEQLLKSD